MAGGKVFCIGNGESRKGFDLETLRPHGKIYGCNALYRDFTPDVLTAVDQGICHEIYHSGYKGKVYFRNWTKLPAQNYEMVLYAGLTQEEINLTKSQWDGLYENDRGNATEFVMHGSNMAGIVNIIRKDKTKYKERINKSYAYISWIREDDNSSCITDVNKNERDRGWACGAMSGYIAVMNEKPTDVYLIGQDLYSHTTKVNNLYKGTKNYVTSDHHPTPASNWIDQWSNLFREFPNINFYKVNRYNDARDDVNREIPEWKDINNIKYIDYSTLDFLSGK